MYKHDGPRPCPSLYTSTTVICDICDPVWKKGYSKIAEYELLRAKQVLESISFGCLSHWSKAYLQLLVAEMTQRACAIEL